MALEKVFETAIRAILEDYVQLIQISVRAMKLDNRGMVQIKKHLTLDKNFLDSVIGQELVKKQLFERVSLLWLVLNEPKLFVSVHKLNFIYGSIGA